METVTGILVAGFALVGCCLAVLWCVARRGLHGKEQPPPKAGWSEQPQLCTAEARREEAIQRSLSAQSPIWPPGTPLDTSALAPRISQVRKDYVAALHSRLRPARCQDRLVKTARKTVRTLSFFRRQTVAPSDHGEHEE
jgi:hypothetical protein